MDVGLNLLERVPDRDDPDRVRVGLAKDRPEAGDLLRLLQAHLLGVHLESLLDEVIGDGLNLAQVVDGDRLVVRKVESQSVGRNKGSLLVDVVAQDLAQRKVENMRASVVVSDGPPSQLQDVSAAKQ